MTDVRKPIRMLLTGGGTGGHLFPGIAAAEALRSRVPGSEVVFVGTRRKMDRTSLSRYGFATRSIHCRGLKGTNAFALLQALVVLPLSFLEAAWHVFRFRPDIVLGVGGYVTGPVVATARLLGIPTVIHEQNSVPGMANKKLGGLVDRICLSIPGSERYFPVGKTVLTGNPVRSGILDLADRGVKPAGDAAATVLVLGGSQGAHRVNELAAAALIRCRGKVRGGLNIIHQTGAADEEMVRGIYRAAGIEAWVSAFFTDMAEVYGKADLLISRAGATTLAELAVLGKPAILIPYPYAADNHQEKNARQYVDGGGALMFIERDLTETVLADTVQELVVDAGKLQEMARNMKEHAYPRAADEIVDVCLRLVAEKSGLNVFGSENRS